MQNSQAASQQRIRAERPLSDPIYARGNAVLQNPALISRGALLVKSKLSIWASALATGAVVFLFALGLQWTIYDRYLHESGVRVVGSAIAAAIAIGLVVTLGLISRNQRKREIERLKTIALLNHHIRNALQAIVTCSGSTDSTDVIRTSAERIEWALGEVLPDISREPNPSLGEGPPAI